LINSVSFAAIFIALFLMGQVPQQRMQGAKVDLSAIGDGIRFITSAPIIFSSMILDFIATFFSSATALLPIFAQDVWQIGEVGYGWLSAAQSVGAAVTAVIFSQLTEVRRQGRVLLGAVIAYGLATILFGLAPGFDLAFVALALVGASDTVSMVIRNTIRQLQTPDEMRGRMTSINQLFFMGGPQLGELEAGAVAQVFGPVISVITGGIGCIIGVVFISRRWPQLLNYQGDEQIIAG
jgi:MFS family permease